MRALLTLAAAGLVLAACATPTPYQRNAEGSGGFSELQLEPNRYRVEFAGNSLTDRATVESYLLYRASEITLQSGGDWFLTVTRGTDTDTSFMSTPSTWGARGRGYWAPGWYDYRYYHPAWGWRPFHDPFWDDVTVREITRFTASAEIVVGKGPKPDQPNAYDARRLQDALRGQIVRPTP